VTRAQLLEGDWSIRARGNVYPEWTDGPDSHHVITWSQFQAVFKQRRIPSHWLGACGHDWGFDPDPGVVVWNFAAAENSPLPGAVFVPAILTCHKAIPDDIAEQITQIEEREGWGSRIQYRVMSHEASSQQATYLRKHELFFQKCKPDAHGGISQMQNYLRLRDTDEPHPFKPWLKGRPNYFLVVPDDQILNPKEDYGLALLRAEFASYRYTEERVTPHLGAAPIKPYKHFDHYMDAQRYVAVEWFAPAAALTFEEKLERRLPPHLKQNPDRSRDPLALSPQDGRNFGRLMAIAEERAKLEKEEVGPFSSFWEDLD
jgi:hypothetical protein